MDQQNIDRLFREKLDQLEVKPSSSAWLEVEKQIRPKKTSTVYWVAASVFLLLISWVVRSKIALEQQSALIVSEVNAPNPVDMPEFVMPVIKKTEEKQQVKKPLRKLKAQPRFTVNRQEVVKVEEQKQLPIMELENKTTVAMKDIDSPKVLEKVSGYSVKAGLRTVKITYIASSRTVPAESVHKTDSIGVLKKFIAFAEKIDLGNMLADIKTAKDNLLNSGLKKKDRNSL